MMHQPIPGKFTITFFPSLGRKSRIGSFAVKNGWQALPRGGKRSSVKSLGLANQGGEKPSDFFQNYSTTRLIPIPSLLIFVRIVVRVMPSRLAASVWLPAALSRTAAMSLRSTSSITSS